MVNKKISTRHVVYHNDGSIWAKGRTVKGVPVGYWEWFRKGGAKMRSGTFKNGVQDGVWTTYDRNGNVYKVTQIKPKPKAKSRAKSKAATKAKVKSAASAKSK